PRHVDDVGVAVGVHVNGQYAEAVDVVAGEAHLAEAMLRPARRLIPGLPGNDVEPAVAVDVGDGGRLAGPRIDHLNLEGDIWRAALGKREQGGRRDEKQFAHEGDCSLSFPLTSFSLLLPFALCP